MERLLELSLGCGAANLTAMEVLQRGHTTNFGVPEPSVVSDSRNEGRFAFIGCWSCGVPEPSATSQDAG